MNQRPLQQGKRYFLKQSSQTVQAIISSLDSRIDIQNFEPIPTPPELGVNDIGEVRFRTSKPLIFDGYATNRLTGSFILVEQGTNQTVAAGMLYPPTELVKPEYNDFAI
jgi:sulfate adenylyltransferase subunit 1 (EFTu-like GTPase family)